MRTTLDYIGTQKLNAASSATPSGASDPVTGLPISTGTNSGDFIELTAAQAKQLSKTSVGTLFEGVYQRVKLSATGASNVGLGQALFWNDANDTTDPYPVTNTFAASGTAANEYAGTVIDPSTTPGQYCWIQINGRATVAITSGSGATVGQYVSYPVGAPNVYTTGSSAPATNIGVGSVLTAQPAATNLTLVAITRPQTKF